VPTKRVGRTPGRWVALHTLLPRGQRVSPSALCEAHVSCGVSAHHCNSCEATDLEREEACLAHSFGVPVHDQLALSSWACGEAVRHGRSIGGAKLLTS
jgi:hypothetical protein